MDLTVEISATSVKQPSDDLETGGTVSKSKSLRDDKGDNYFDDDSNQGSSSTLDASATRLENIEKEEFNDDDGDTVESFDLSSETISINGSNTITTIKSTLDGSDDEDETIIVSTDIDETLLKYPEFQHLTDVFGEDVEEDDGSSGRSKRKRKSKCPVKTAKMNLLEDPTKSFMCTVCGKVFNKKCNLQDHLRIHTGEKPYKCGICSKGFTVNSSLQVHLRTHTGEKPFQCSQCGKTFTVSSSLNAHMKIHTGDRKYQCKECHKTFVKNGDLKNHMTSHTGERRFQCNICYKRFSKTSSLTLHRKLHLGEVYKCPEPKCEKEFPTSTYLHMHMKYHSKEKPFKCVACDKAYRVKGDLQIHMRNHSGEKPFKCDVCFKGFTRNDTLILHMRTHTGEKPYECPICGRKFSVNCALHRHIRIHTGVKPYVCVICAKAFDSSSNRQKHMKTHQHQKEMMQRKIYQQSDDIEIAQGYEITQEEKDIATQNLNIHQRDNEMMQGVLV